jgi:hypothetical protein
MQRAPKEVSLDLLITSTIIKMHRCAGTYRGRVNETGKEREKPARRWHLPNRQTSAGRQGMRVPCCLLQGAFLLTPNKDKMALKLPVSSFLIILMKLSYLFKSMSLSVINIHVPRGTPARNYM